MKNAVQYKLCNLYQGSSNNIFVLLFLSLRRWIEGVEESSMVLVLDRQWQQYTNAKLACWPYGGVLKADDEEGDESKYFAVVIETRAMCNGDALKHRIQL